MNNNIMTLYYIYAKVIIYNLPYIFYKLAHAVLIITWIPSRLALTQ